MNIKHKESQLKAIILALEDRKSKEQQEITRITATIKKKEEVISRIHAYRAEYDSSHKIRLSHTIPALLKNMNAFTLRIDEAIIKERQSVEMFERDRQRHASYLMINDQKLKAMQNQLEKIIHAKLIKHENNSQQTEEELITCRMLGDRNE